MSATAGQVGKKKIVWKKVPQGREGTGLVEVDGRSYEVSWKRDADGLRLETPSGAFGFDFEGEKNDDGKPVFNVSRRGSSERWEGLSFLRDGEAGLAGAAGDKKRSTRVRAQMPGKIIRVSVKAGDAVEKGQSLLVMEAMKMENEIKAPQAGRVALVKVTEGQAVETGADLVTLE